MKIRGLRTEGSREEPNSSRQFDVARAVLLTQCALDGIATRRDSLATEGRRRAYRVVQVCVPVVHTLLAIYLASYIFEVPAWCWLEEDSCGEADVVVRSPLASTLPLHLSRLLQIFCLACFLGYTLAELYALGTWRWQHYFGIAVELFALLDIVIAFFNRYGLPPKRIYWSPLLRPFIFLGMSRHVRRFIANALPAMLSRTIVDLVMLQGLILITWAWLGLLLFAGTAEGDAYFSSYVAAILSLFTLFTTANFPDVMMQAYSRNGWTCCYFCAYLIMSLYIIFDVLLAALFTSYKARMHQNDEMLKARSNETLSLAFEILAGSDGKEPADGVTRESWKTFCLRFGRSRGVRWNELTVEALFDSLAALPGGLLDLECWLLVAPELRKPAKLGLEAPELGAERRRSYALGVLHWTVDFLVVLSLASTVAHTSSQLQREQPITECAWWQKALHLMVCVLYLLEALLRVAVLGRCQLYSYRWWADMTLAIACSGLEVFLHAFGPGGATWRRRNRNQRACNHLLALLRAARVERVLWRFSRLRATLEMLLALFSTFRTAGAAMFFIFYLYGTVGEQVFGGRVRRDASGLWRTDFARAGRVGYWANNFNDFASGIVVLFELMVVNNWNIIAEGLAAVTPGPPCVGWLFCISFYFCIRIVVLNVLVTSVVETYERLQAPQQPCPAAAMERLSNCRQGSPAPPPSAAALLDPDELVLEPVRCLSSAGGVWTRLASQDEALLLRKQSLSRREQLEELLSRPASPL